MRNRKWNKRSLIIEILMTLFMGFMMFLNILGNLESQTLQYTYNLKENYRVTIQNYTVSFQLIVAMVEEKLKEDPSLDEMNIWLQSKEDKFIEIFGDAIYDGFALTYKGGYARSWDYGDYTNYDPNTRPWYQQAREANGEITVVAPYVAFLDASYYENDDYILMTIAQKHNEEISYDLDLKISGIRDLLYEKELGYADGEIYLIDLNGYILSSTDKRIYCRNINVTDDYISRDFGETIHAAMQRVDRLQQRRIDGRQCILYCSQDNDGNTFLIIIPVWEFVWKNFALLGLIILCLIAFEVFLYKRFNHTFFELKTRDERMNTIINSAFHDKIFLHLDSMKYAKEMDEEKTLSYQNFFEAFKETTVEAEELQILNKHLSPEALKDLPADNQLHDFVVTIQIETKDDVDVKRVLRIGVMVSMQENHKTATILINDITKEREDQLRVLESMAEHYYAAYVCNLEHRNFQVIKSERRFADSTDLSLPYEGAIQYYADKWVDEEFRSVYLEKLNRDYVLRKLQEVRSYDITIKLINNHWVTVSIIRCIGDAAEKRFLLCKSDADEMMQQQEILQKALDEARQANLAKSEFLSRMSHDMRTPLNGILGVADLMSDQTDLEEIEKQLQLIRMSGNYLLNLINDTLDMNKIESGKLELHKKPMYQENMIQEIVHNMERMALDKNQKFECSVPTQSSRNWLPVLADAPRIAQIFMNLLSNAIKYTPEGGTITFTMETCKITKEHIRSRYTVRDTGIGMSEEFLKHMFDPFAQEGRMNLTRESSTGLGLSIVKKLVDLMNGTIDVSSKLNQGTVYILTLDLERYYGEIEEHVEAFHDEILVGKRILLCEDHPLNQQIAQKLLERKGLLVETANNGQEGLDKFKASGTDYYQLILMDIRMPVMNGLEAANAIRGLTRKDAETIPIIAMTANAFDDDVKVCMEAGMNAHIAKPIEVDKMYQVLIRYLQ